jgi:hypothetical protein
MEEPDLAPPIRHFGSFQKIYGNGGRGRDGPNRAGQRPELLSRQEAKPGCNPADAEER